MNSQSSDDDAEKTSTGRKRGSKSSQASGAGGRSRPPGKKKPTRPRRRARADRSSDDSASDDSAEQDSYEQFMQSYGTAHDIATVPTDKSDKTNKKSSPAQRRLPDVSLTGLGLMIQGGSLGGAVTLLLTILVLWTFGYLESGASWMGWTVIVLGGAAALAGEGMCLTVPPESRARNVGIAALVCAGLALLSLVTDALTTRKGATFAQLLDLFTFVAIATRMWLVSLFLSRLATYAQEPVYETRSVFAMTGMPLAAVAIFAYLHLAPPIDEETASSTRAILTGIQWWIIMTSVAVVVMYISILLGMGRSLQRRSR